MKAIQISAYRYPPPTLRSEPNIYRRALLKFFIRGFFCPFTEGDKEPLLLRNMQNKHL
jgi:hypothetical protein